MRDFVDGQYTGRVLGGRYRLLAQVDKGGMGAVYEAVQEGLGRKVAVKLLHPHLARDATLLERFRREADMAGSLGHPNIVQITDFQSLEGEPAIIVMEYLAGTPLSKVLSGGRTLDQARLVNVAVQVCAGLGAAHDAGIVHRDLKPANIFLTELAGGTELVKLLDFGIAKLKESAEYQRLTRTGVLVGTPQFMAPEQAQGLDDVDGRADLWALGVCMYRALTGTLPFGGDTPADLWKAILSANVTPIDAFRPDVDPELVSVVMRTLVPDRAKRIGSAAEMQQAMSGLVLRASLPAPPPAPPRTRVAQPARPIAVPGAFPTVPGALPAAPLQRPSQAPPRRSSAPPPRGSSIPAPPGRAGAARASRPRARWVLPVAILAVVAVLLTVTAVALVAFGVLGVGLPQVTAPHPMATPPPPAPAPAPAPGGGATLAPTPPSAPDSPPPGSGATLAPTLPPSAPDSPPPGSGATPAPAPALDSGTPSGTGLTPAPPPGARPPAGREGVRDIGAIVVGEGYRHSAARAALSGALPAVRSCYASSVGGADAPVDLPWRLDVDEQGTVSNVRAAGARGAGESLVDCMKHALGAVAFGRTRTGMPETVTVRFTR